MHDTHIFSVSEITGLIKDQLEGNFAGIVVEGELSNYRPSSTGHLYFTLKDTGAVISCALFKNRLNTLSFKPHDGMLLRIRGSISVYGPRGSYQIIAEEMTLAGAGDILAMLEQRKQALADEGLFDYARKRPIPKFPGTVGIVSSPTGAAVRDILTILRRRSACIRVIILPAPVQGTEAAAIIASRIRQANDWHIADVLIVGRGGGPLEDLLPFSEEVVVRAIATSHIPTVSAVGHEIDWALSDFAADLRAPTPSAAAELVSSSRESVMETIHTRAGIMAHEMQLKIERERLRLSVFNIKDWTQRIRSTIEHRYIHLDHAKDDLLRQVTGRIADLRRRLDYTRFSLDASNPRTILERGFSQVIDTKTGAIVRDANTVHPGARLCIHPLAGTIIAQVLEQDKFSSEEKDALG